MMNTKNIFSLLILLLLLSCCQTRPVDPSPLLTIRFERTDAIDLGPFIESVHYVQLENHPESAFIDIDKLVVSGPNIFMLDKRLEAVFCFDTTGRFRYRIQRVGRGPGEYQELEAIWIREDQGELWLQSFWPSKIMVYNFDGRMLREFGFPWPAKDMIGLGNGLMAGYNPTPSQEGRESLAPGVFLLDENGRNMGQALVLGDSSIYWTLTYQRHLEKYGNGALLLTQSDTLYRITDRGEVSPEILLDWGEWKYPDEMRRICYDTPRAGEALKGEYVHGKDHLIAFGPIRLFRIFLDRHMEFALADITAEKGTFSTRINNRVGQIPLLYPIAVSDRDELIGIYDMSLLLALNESIASRNTEMKSGGLFTALDSLVGSALKEDRPVLWFAKIKKEWLSKSF